MNDSLNSRQKIIAQLISARLEKGLSQEQLAKLIGTQRSNICRIESGSQNLSVDMLVKICSALDKEIIFSLEERSEPMSNIYNLKLYNETLLTFSLEEKGLEGLKVEIQSVFDVDKELFPIDMEVSNTGVLKWLQKRVIPKNRAFVDAMEACRENGALHLMGLLSDGGVHSHTSHLWAFLEMAQRSGQHITSAVTEASGQGI